MERTCIVCGAATETLGRTRETFASKASALISKSKETLTILLHLDLGMMKRNSLFGMLSREERSRLVSSLKWSGKTRRNSELVWDAQKAEKS